MRLEVLKEGIASVTERLKCSGEWGRHLQMDGLLPRSDALLQWLSSGQIRKSRPSHVSGMKGQIK